METRIVWRRGRVERACLDDLLLWLLPSLDEQDVLELAPGRLARLLMDRRRDKLPKSFVVSRRVEGMFDLILASRPAARTIAACARSLRPGGQLVLIAAARAVLEPRLARLGFTWRRYDVAGAGKIFDCRRSSA